MQLLQIESHFYFSIIHMAKDKQDPEVQTHVSLFV